MGRNPGADEAMDQGGTVDVVQEVERVGHQPEPPGQRAAPLAEPRAEPRVAAHAGDDHQDAGREDEVRV